MLNAKKQVYRSLNGYCSKRTKLAYNLVDALLSNIPKAPITQLSDMCISQAALFLAPPFSYHHASHYQSAKNHRISSTALLHYHSLLPVLLPHHPLAHNLKSTTTIGVKLMHVVHTLEDHDTWRWHCDWSHRLVVVGLMRSVTAWWRDRRGIGR